MSDPDAIGNLRFLSQGCLASGWVGKTDPMTGVRIPTWTLGDRLRKAREAAGLHQSDMAPHFGRGRSTIAGWENDQHRPGKLEVEKWAEVTGAPLWWLQGFDGDTASVTHRYRPFRQEHLKIAA